MPITFSRNDDEGYLETDKRQYNGLNRMGKPDTIIAQAADAILGKLHFYVIIRAAIDTELKSY